MGKLTENMLQSLRFDRETKTWLTKNWELKNINGTLKVIHLRGKWPSESEPPGPSPRLERPPENEPFCPEWLLESEPLVPYLWLRANRNQRRGSEYRRERLW